jgi:hypothetical protein
MVTPFPSQKELAIKTKSSAVKVPVFFILVRVKPQTSIPPQHPVNTLFE